LPDVNEKERLIISLGLSFHTMWIPRWLGECYSKLYMRFGQELFRFKDAQEFLSFGKAKLSVALKGL